MFSHYGAFGLNTGSAAHSVRTFQETGGHWGGDRLLPLPRQGSQAATAASRFTAAVLMTSHAVYSVKALCNSFSLIIKLSIIPSNNDHD